MESIFTSIYEKNKWGSRETISGPSSTLQRTEELRGGLPKLLQGLQVTSIYDIGCGDWNWMCKVDISGIEYTGVDIVEPLIKKLQEETIKEDIVFKCGDVFTEKPLYTTVWFARDFLCVQSFEMIYAFFKKFVESESDFLAITSVETDKNNDAPIGIWRPINVLLEPFYLPEPIEVLGDDSQWFRKKYLYIYTQTQIQEWISSTPSKSLGRSLSKDDDKLDRNRHLQSNVPLRNMSLHGHKV